MSIGASLRKNKHFAVLPPADIEALERAFTFSGVKVGDQIFSEGDRDEAIYLLREGEVEVTQYERRRVHNLRHLHAGELFGMHAVIEGRRRGASCAAVTDATLGVLPTAAVSPLFNQSGPLAYASQKALAVQLAHDFREADKRLRALVHPEAGRPDASPR